jgi:hypothetical protein
VVFGHVENGKEIVEILSGYNEDKKGGTPSSRIEIADCGVATEYMEKQRQLKKKVQPVYFYTDFYSIEC